MAEWIFTHPDTWVVAPHPDLEWLDGDTEDTVMARHRYSYCQRSSGWDTMMSCLGSWTLWEADSPDVRYQYAVWLSLPNDRCTVVWLPTDPDLMAYMRLYGSVGQAQVARDDSEALYTLMKRLFRAWHGHDAELSCRACDPESYEESQRLRARLAARRAAAQS